MIEKLKSIALLLDWSEISTEYLGKPESWPYKVLKGEVAMTADEKTALKNALNEVADKIKDVAATL